MPEVYKTDSPDPEISAYQQHQKQAARVTCAEDARIIMSQARFGVLSTVSSREEAAGMPLGSVVEFAVDDSGCPVFALSSLASHCGDLKQDGSACLTVMSPNFKSIMDPRFSLQGQVREVSKEEKPKLRETYLKKYPDAFWIDFQDFRFFIMEDIVVGRFQGGFARNKRLTPEEYKSASTDPVAAFSLLVCSHMNADHSDSIRAMVKHYVGLTVEEANMLSLDRLGMNLEVKHKGQTLQLRLPYPAPVDNRKAIKEAIVGMTKASAAAMAAPAAN